MTNRLSNDDREVLQFRPNIHFVEPEGEPQVLNPIEPPVERQQLEDALQELDKLRILASAVDSLAGAVQARADDKARNMSISLDSSVDTDTVQAMLRLFPNGNPNEITYEQYKKCKDDLLNKGIELAEQGIVTPEDIQNARDEAQADGSNSGSKLGGFGTEDASRGLLRPELQSDFIIIPPLDIPNLQINLICILVNFIWKEFVKPFLIAGGPPLSILFEFLPDEICNAGFSLDLPGLIILGKPPNIPQPPSIPTQAPEIGNI